MRVAISNAGLVVCLWQKSKRRHLHEAQSALDYIKAGRNSIDYWEKCKQETLIESEKNEIFIDGINAKLEIIEKYRK